MVVPEALFVIIFRSCNVHPLTPFPLKAARCPEFAFISSCAAEVKVIVVVLALLFVQFPPDTVYLPSIRRFEVRFTMDVWV